MACGCNSDAGASGPLLTGTLDPAFANPAGSSSSSSSQQEGILAENSSGNGFSFAGVLVAGLLVALVFGGAWLLDKTKKDRE